MMMKIILLILLLTTDDGSKILWIGFSSSALNYTYIAKRDSPFYKQDKEAKQEREVPRIGKERS